MSITSIYQIAFLGRAAEHRSKLDQLLLQRLDELGIDRTQVPIINECDVPNYDRKSPLVTVFFGYDAPSDADHASLQLLISDSITIIPCIDSVENASRKLPPSLSHINAFPLKQTDAGYERLATLILENLRLLRAERRLFISYKRSDSQSVAIQLYECFDKAGFDVFLDTRSVPYGSVFQGVLWHRMADSDIVVLLDTPNFRSSAWTTQELSQANATNIQILHLLWPTITPDASSAFSIFHRLETADFVEAIVAGSSMQLTATACKTVVAQAESLRARALAARHRSLVDGFCDRAREEQVGSVAVQPHRFITVETPKDGKIAVVPTIGLPRADRYQEIETAVRSADLSVVGIWLLYDERGILDTWLEHLAWLDDHLPVISVKLGDCSMRLRGGSP